MDRLAWLCSVPEGLGEDSSSESLSKGTNSGRESPSVGPGAISKPEPEMEMCRQGCDPGSAIATASSSAVASTSSSCPAGSEAVSGGFLSDSGCSLRNPKRVGREWLGGAAEALRQTPSKRTSEWVSADSQAPAHQSWVSPVAVGLQAGHCPDAEDAGRADSDAGLHVRLSTQAQQAHLAHVAVAVAHPHLRCGLWAAAEGGSRTRKLQGHQRTTKGK